VWLHKGRSSEKSCELSSPERIVPISTLASLTAKTYQASQTDDGWQRFTQLVAAVNAGNLTSAQKAFDAFSSSAAADLAKASPTSRLTQALDVVGRALQSGDIGGAQQALSTIRSRPLGSDTNAAAQPPKVASPKIAPADQSAPGGAVDIFV
jgi:hypothetical protein